MLQGTETGFVGCWSATIGGFCSRERRLSPRRRQHARGFDNNLSMVKSPGSSRISSNGTDAALGRTRRLEGMCVGISGATGFIGVNVVRGLKNEGVEKMVILTRNVAKARLLFPPALYPAMEFVPYDASEAVTPSTRGTPLLAASLADCDAVVNLAGKPIADGTWTPERKAVIRDSRVIGTGKIVSALREVRRSQDRPVTLISASAVGYYGPSESKTFSEASPAGKDFLAHVALQWEQAALQAQKDGIRTVVLRLGLVMGKNGGALQKLSTAFNAFVGGKLGTGSQWVSWVHMEDVVNVIVEVLYRESYSGVVNVTAPKPVRFSEVCTELSSTLNRPSWLHVPGSVLNLVLGEAAQLIVAGQRVRPTVLMRAGYSFRHENLRSAFRKTFKTADEVARR